MKIFRACVLKDMITNNSENALKAKSAIRKFCDNGSSRQKNTLYDFLDRELGIRMNRLPYDYKSRGTEHPRFECTDKEAVSSVMYRIIMELEAKKKN